MLIAVSARTSFDEIDDLWALAAFYMAPVRMPNCALRHSMILYRRSKLSFLDVCLLIDQCIAIWLNSNGETVD